ncbi:MAG: hypothetical protein KAT70_02175 [Thermoplasmata archaeon]|nr:hypothetical protein [Thermoplasmata archaeon]
MSKFGKRAKIALERNLILLALIIVGAIGRICLAVMLPQGTFDMFAFVVLISLSAGYVTRRWAALFVPIGIMVSSDIFLYFFSGNAFPFSSSLLIMVSLFVWSGFAMAAFLGMKVHREDSYPSPLWFAAGGVWSVLLFDMWTNFGWWLGPFYPHTFAGFGACMAMAVPFMVWHMLSTLALMPLFYLGIWAVNKYGADLPAVFRSGYVDTAEALQASIEGEK